MKMLVVLLGLIFSVASFSNNAFTKSRLSSTATSYAAYMRAADEHLNYGRIDEAIILYKLATEVATKENKIRAYMQIVENYYKMGLEWDAGSWLRKTTSYLDTNPTFKNDENYLFYLYYKVILSGNLSSEVLTGEEIAVLEGDDIYGQLVEHDFKTNIIRKNYAAAFEAFQDLETSQFPMTHKIYYDLSHFLNNNGNINHLICSETLAESPFYKDYNASYNFCYVLEDYLATKVRDENKMKTLKKMIEEKDIGLLFLYNALNSNI